MDAFQFYDSPIKRRLAYVNTCTAHAFQFYDSPIKSRLNRTIVAVHCGFQFYDSPIKRVCGGSRKRSTFFSFNSMIVRLKGALGVKTNSPEDFVSIL